MSDYRFTFPRVLKAVVSHEASRTATTKAITVDAAAKIRLYFRDFYDGAEFERFVRSDANLAHPHSLSMENTRAARLIRARPLNDEVIRRWLSENDLAALLSRIPNDADLFMTSAFDLAAGEILSRLARIPNVKTANATKLLHQKRPSLIPILDDLVRRAIGLAETPAWTADDYRALLVRFRGILNEPGNRDCVERIIADWKSLDTGFESPPSRVRIVDVIAWTTIRESDPWK